ncbi:MAG: acetate--CoA ligase family protein [Pseudomonadota bacterium]
MKRIDHWLTPLLTPRSVALAGASRTVSTIMTTLNALGFDGPVYPVNPRREEVDGVACHPYLTDLPEPVDLAVLAVGDERIEEQLALAIKSGARAASVFASCVIDEDAEIPLAERLTAMAREANLPISGGNSMGFCNYEAGIRINSYPFSDREPGSMTFLSQSGSVFGAFTNNNPRLDLNLAVSCGRELTVSAADYMDYVLELESTKVIGMFLETIRDPAGFIAALEKAERRGVPVVAVKAGRTEKAAKMAVSHSGALAGDDMAHDAVFRRYGLLRVDTLDELAASMLMMNVDRPTGPGDLATIHESGGERELIVDLAEDLGVPFAQINEQTVARLAERLDFGLAPENPCDAFGTGHDFDGMLRDCFQALVDDPQTALGVFFLDLNQDNWYSPACAAACMAVRNNTTKPVALATNYSAVNHHTIAVELTAEGLPVLDGTVAALKAVRHAFHLRDWRERPRDMPAPVDVAVKDRWRQRLATGEPFDEADGLALLADYGIGVPQSRIATTKHEAEEAANTFGFPVVMKTAMPEIHHKSDVGGVVLNVPDVIALRAAYDDLAERLGPRVLVEPMVTGGVELVLGVTIDPQFGPMVLVGAGGVLVEVMGDVAALVAPAPAWEVRRVIDGLAVRKLLDGVRGGPPLDVEAAVEAVVRLSVLAADLGDLLRELDVNPLLVREEGAVALDALVMPA